MQQNEEHELIKVKISDVKLDKTNPNQMSKEQMAGLRQSMERWGYLTPIILDQDNNICDGEHRLLVYKQLGCTEIPAYRLHLESDAERRMIRQVMNKLHGIHDRQLDADELATLFENNKLDDLSKLIAQQKEDLERLILRYHPSLDFRHPEDPAELDKLIDDEMKKMAPDTQLGDIYQLGRHRLVCGDCSDKRSVDRLMEGSKASAVLTDPPYQMGKDIENDDLEQDEYGQLHVDFMRTSPVTEDATMICFHGTRAFPIAIDAGRQTNWQFKRMLWLSKPNDITFPWRGWILISESILVFARGKGSWNEIHPFHHDTYEFNHKGGELAQGVGWHPSVKPLEVITDLVNRISKANDIIYDPLIGSGTTMLACEKTGRVCYAIDIDPRYIDVTVKRWEAYTGQKAQKLT